MNYSHVVGLTTFDMWADSIYMAWHVAPDGAMYSTADDWTNTGEHLL